MAGHAVGGIGLVPGVDVNRLCASAVEAGQIVDQVLHAAVSPER